jgi:hypothetical protein
MTITPELISLGTAVGVGIGWVAKHYQSNWNGNGKLTKEDHDKICRLTTEPFKERFIQGEAEFRELRQMIENKFDSMYERIDRLIK